MTSNNVDQARVSSSIQTHILDFANEHVGQTFHMGELTEYVNGKVTTAPDSAGRILRALRADGLIDYDLISRAHSEYLIKQVVPADA